MPEEEVRIYLGQVDAEGKVQRRDRYRAIEREGKVRDPRLKDAAWRARVGFDNVVTIEEHLRDMPAEKRYRTMDRLDARGYYDRRKK